MAESKNLGNVLPAPIFDLAVTEYSAIVGCDISDVQVQKLSVECVVEIDDTSTPPQYSIKLPTIETRGLCVLPSLQQEYDSTTTNRGHYDFVIIPTPYVARLLRENTGNLRGAHHPISTVDYCRQMYGFDSAVRSFDGLVPMELLNSSDSLKYPKEYFKAWVVYFDVFAPNLSECSAMIPIADNV